MSFSKRFHRCLISHLYASLKCSQVHILGVGVDSNPLSVRITTVLADDRPRSEANAWAADPISFCFSVLVGSSTALWRVSSLSGWYGGSVFYIFWDGELPHTYGSSVAIVYVVLWLVLILHVECNVWLLCSENWTHFDFKACTASTAISRPWYRTPIREQSASHSSMECGAINMVRPLHRSAFRRFQISRLACIAENLQQDVLLIYSYQWYC